MKIKISRENIVYFFILINPLIEIMYSFTEKVFSGSATNWISINRIFRMMFLMIVFFSIRKLKSFIKIIVGFLWVLLSLIVQNFMGFTNRIGTDISYLIKIIFGIVLYLYFVEQFEKDKKNEEKVFFMLIIASYIICVNVLFSWLGVGNVSYGNSGRFGVKGSFAIQSTISAYLLIILPLIFLYCRGKMRILSLLLISLTLISIGTKTGVIGCVLTFLITGLGKLLQGIKKKRISKKLLMVFVFGTFISAIVICIFIYKYIPYLLQLFKSKSYYNNNIYTFLVSNRDTQLNVVRKYIKMLDKKNKIINIIFGSGYSCIEKILHGRYSEFYTIEQDFYNIFYCCGIVVLGIICYIIVKAILISLKGLKEENTFYILLCAFIGVIHAFFGGHVITDSLTLVPFYASISWLYVHKKNK